MRPYKTSCCAEHGLNLYGYFYWLLLFCATFMPHLCMTLNCVLHYCTFKGNVLYFQVIGDISIILNYYTEY